MSRRARVYLALLHHPVYNKRRAKVATAITNLDVHDLARLGRTFGVRRTYVVTPVAAQQALALRIVGHWCEGEGGDRNPFRAEAMARMGVAADLAAVVADVSDREGERPRIVATGAGFADADTGYDALGAFVARGEAPVLLVLGTGWGLHEDVLAECDSKLEPVYGVDGYNHLAVRSAAAIILDRLLGRRGREGSDIEGER